MSNAADGNTIYN